MTLNQVLAKQAQNYSGMSEDQLLAELGRRLETLSEEPTQKTILSTADAAMPLPTAALAGPIADRFRGIAKSFLNRFNNDLYRLMCDFNDPDNQKIQGAFKMGEESAAIFISGLILAQFAWLPAIVAIVVGLIIRRFIQSLANSTYEATCKAWGTQLGLIK